MKKKAIIYDLDNTLYPVRSIGTELFTPLFEMISEEGYLDVMDQIKVDLMSKPFQVVAEKYFFGEVLNQKCLDLLRQLTYEGKLETFEDYEEIKRFSGARFLVTTGFHRLQWSKIRNLGIENDFVEIHVVDPSVSPLTKKEVFIDILVRNGIGKEEVLVVGDDPESEIQAGRALGIETVLYDKANKYQQNDADFKIDNFRELKKLLVKQKSF